MHHLVGRVVVEPSRCFNDAHNAREIRSTSFKIALLPPGTDAKRRALLQLPRGDFTTCRRSPEKPDPRSRS